MSINKEKVYQLLNKGYANTTQQLIDFLSLEGMKSMDVYKSLDSLELEGYIVHDVEKDLWNVLN
jgi:DNA-binding PadR family transcriptional regulator